MPLSFFIMGIVTAIIACFGEEIANLLKKIARIPGIKLMVPMTLLSWGIIKNQPTFIYVVTWFNTGLQYLTAKLAQVLNIRVAEVLILTMLALLPPLVSHFLVKGPNRSKSMTICKFIGLFLWLFAVMLYVLN